MCFYMVILVISRLVLLGSVALLSNYTSSEVPFLDLVFLSSPILVN